MKHANKTVLAVDDDQVMRIFAEEALTSAGFNVITADSGQTALDVLAEQRVDIILLDIVMPGMDGFETCRKLKAMPGCENIPVVMLTGLDDTEAVQQAYDAGAWDFASKPINWSVLQHRLRYILRSSESLSIEKQAARLSRTIDSSHSEVYTFDARNWTIIDANSSALSNLGYSLVELRARRFTDIATDTTNVGLAVKLEYLRDEQQANMRLDLQRADGSTYPVEGLVFHSDDENPEVFIGVLRDMTEEERAEAELHRLAYYDELTSLPNRRLMQERAAALLSDSGDVAGKAAVCILDLDGFKLINDTIGHSTGDLLLKEVAERLQSVIRQADYIARNVVPDNPTSSHQVARLGGDEFLIMLTDFDDSSVPANVASRILEQIALPYHIHRIELSMTGSMGIAMYPQDGKSLEELMMHADSAMYTAKREGKNKYAFFTPRTSDHTISRFNMKADLRKAVDNGELVLHYQPQVDGSLQNVVGAEALLRWQRACGDFVLPNQFIPLAEETGLIIPIGEWILEDAMRQLKEWAPAMDANFKMSVNVSALQLRQEGFAPLVKQLLERYPDLRGRLVLELTESALMNNAEHRISLLSEIKETGAQIAIDDFGTGYSSLSYLNRFPIDYLKVDRSFINDINANRENAAITRAIFRMAQELDIALVAEGVETMAQLETIRTMGECQVQGWLVSKALAANDMFDFYHSHQLLALQALKSA